MDTSLSPSASVELYSTSKIPAFVHGIAFFLAILILIVTLLVASYLCARANTTALPSLTTPNRPATDIEAGLDEAALTSYPIVIYWELAKIRPGEKGSTAACCSICLTDYKGSDELRQLPECGHAFHAKCVDPWLRLHPSCPLCRTSPLPTPLVDDAL